MKIKTIGILGGMGPEATLDCFGKIIGNTPAASDQDHLRVLMDCNPKIPDRTAAIIGDGASPVPQMAAGCRALARAGADFIIIPCVSAHFFLEALQADAPLPIISIFDAVTAAVLRYRPAIRTVGLMGTTGTIQGGLFQKRLDSDGIRTVVPPETQQTDVMAAIYAIKDTQAGRSREAIGADLQAVAQDLVANQGAQAIIAGCTEIPLALKQAHLSVPYFDSLTVLARSAIRTAGVAPIRLPASAAPSKR